MEEPESKPLIPFMPVSLRTRRDGWSEARSLPVGQASSGSDKHIGFARAPPPRVRTRLLARSTANFGNFRGPADPRGRRDHSDHEEIVARLAPPRSRFHAQPIAATLFHSAGGEADMYVLNRAGIPAMLVAQAKAALAPFAGVAQ